uniref:Plexin-B1 n=1 Tax=Esox lucius TaxID=8010 RepID=A0A6Q2ZCB3_ESOLU
MPLGMSSISAFLLFLTAFSNSFAVRTHPSFSRNDTTFEHMVLHPDPSVGTVYVGARDRLFQLDGLDGLRLEQEERTGPVIDSRECLPPVTRANCPQARLTSNHNKLLLVDPSAMQLITCGNVHQGTCQKRSLDSVKEVLFSTDRPVDTQYVAANDPDVSTVGLVVGPRGGGRTVLYVGRGYTSSHPPISTRHLAGDLTFSHEETAKLAVAGRLSEYDHHFVTAFARRGHVYFLFYRRDIKAASREYRTYAARVCLDDTSYYSYVEVPLVCRSNASSSPERSYNLLQAAQVGNGGGREAEALLGVFSARVSSSNGPSEDSALCVYPLDELDQRIDSTRDLCYTQDGRVEGGGGGVPLAYIEYEVKSSCANLPRNTLSAYPCGSDHTPSPMASSVPMKAVAVFERMSTRLTAVAVSVRAGHSIAFLGDSKGNLHKVFLGSEDKAKLYSSTLIQSNSPILSDLLLDQTERNIYIMTGTTRPVAECGDHLDCQHCLSARDPYCGWCLLEGRCGWRSQCRRGDLPGQWLWSFDRQQQCLTIQSLSLYNISYGEKTAVRPLEDWRFFVLFFLPKMKTPLFKTRLSVFIRSSTDSVSVPLSLRFHNVTLAAQEFTFFDCGLVQQLSGRMPCRGCVSSPWGCNWCVHQHVCTHEVLCDQGVTIYNKHVSPPDCPCVEKVQGSSLLPVNAERKITLVGRHFDLFKVRQERLRKPKSFLFYLPCVVCKLWPTRAIGVCVCVYLLTLFNCSVGRSDCSRCRTADQKYGCVWCGGAHSRCSHHDSCADEVTQSCPAPIEPASGPVEGGTMLTISGSNLGQKAEDIQDSVNVAGVPCTVISSRYEISSRFGSHHATVFSLDRLGLSGQRFSFQDPVLLGVIPQKGPMAGGSALTIKGQNLKTGHPGEVSVLIGGVPCVAEDQITCVTGVSNRTGEHGVTVRFGRAKRHLEGAIYHYTLNPNITMAAPSKSFLSGGRTIRVSGQNLDVVQEPRIRALLFSVAPFQYQMANNLRCCVVSSSSLILCQTPAVGPEARRARIRVDFLMDNLHFDFSSVGSGAFSYELNPILFPLNRNDPGKPYHHKPGSVISVEGENLDLAIFKEEVVARIGEGLCSVKTLTHNHLYCEPPSQPPLVLVQMGNLNFSLGRVQYDSQGQSTFPLEAQVGVGVGASIVALIVLIIVLIYRRKSQRAMRDYKKVQIQLENLETSVRDRCKKEFTDLMTEMMDCSSDLVGSGIPFLDYRAYAERIFFPGHRESPLRRDLDVPECRRQTVEQGLVQLSNLLNSKLFLTKFIHTLEVQRTFSPRDRAYVASLLTVALHGKLEYFTDILKTLLNDLVVQYVAKNPKLMLRRTESVVEKLLTNWMSICLFTFLRDTAGESFYMLFRAIKHQVDKGPVDAVTGKAKYTLNDNRLLREDVEYKTLTLNVLVPATGNGSVPQTAPAKVLDCDTITQVKEKVLEQAWKGMSFSQRPHTDSLHLEWRAGVAGHLILSDEDLTSVVQGSWKRLNTLQHYKVPDGATVALVPRTSKHIHNDSHDYFPGEKTPMLDDGDEGGVKLWHLVKANEETDLPKHRRGSLRDRERAKAIPEIYLTRLLSMKGTLQKFVDDLFTVILSTNQPVPMAVKYFFDLLDEQALQHNITDPETIHIWKTNSLPLRFWINILKNPQFIFDVQASDHVDAVLSVIAQTFMDSCTIAEHKLGRDSPINKLLYARDIPRYKQMVERYYADIRQTISASDQEMNSALAELSRNYASEVNYLVALHELYKYINKYYDQIITALEEDPAAQKMQLGYRLQQVAAAVENKVTDL